MAPPKVTATVLPASAVPLTTGVGSLVVSAATVGVAMAVSNVRLPLPLLALPAASVLVRLMALAPSAPRLNVPEAGVAVPVSTLHWPEPLAVTR